MTDKRKNANVKKGNLFKMEWMYSDYVDYFLRNLFGNESVMNHCCGFSTVGQFRYDIDENTARTSYGNLFEITKDFKPNSVDHLLIDAPFKFFNPYCKEIAFNYPKGIDVKGRKYGDPFQWQFDALTIPRKSLVLRRNLITTNWSGNISKFQEYFLIKDSRPSSTILEIVWK